MNRLDTIFSATRASRRGALILYLTAGYPNAGTTRELLRVLPAAGADIIELGVPFSDPIADGPVIQRASSVALENGMTLDGALTLSSEFRANDSKTGLVFFGAYNPFAARGDAQAARLVAAAGGDGILAADLPVEESGPLRDACAARGMHLISLVAPTTPSERMKKIASASSGFLYCISRRGVTGAQNVAASESAADYLARLRGVTELPLALGFGISTPEHVREAVAAGADGIVVGTALINVIDRAVEEGTAIAPAVAEYVRSLAAATATEVNA